MIDEMFNAQKHLQSIVGGNVSNQQYKNDHAYALIREITEAIDQTPWKHWKKNQTLNIENYKKELIDCWAFLINLTFPVMDPEELFDLFMMKYIENVQRQRSGY